MVGVFWGAFTMRDREQHLANVAELMQWLRDGKLKPHIGKRYKLEEAATALRDMMDRKAKGKLLLIP